MLSMARCMEPAKRWTRSWPLPVEVPDVGDKLELSDPSVGDDKLPRVESEVIIGSVTLFSSKS